VASLQPVRQVHGVLRADIGTGRLTMNWKKIITWTLVIFALYTIFSNPARAADIVNNGINFIAQAGDSVGRFFDALVA
jgi:hypothetical protein